MNWLRNKRKNLTKEDVKALLEDAEDAKRAKRDQREAATAYAVLKKIGAGKFTPKDGYLYVTLYGHKDVYSNGECYRILLEHGYKMISTRENDFLPGLVVALGVIE